MSAAAKGRGSKTRRAGAKPGKVVGVLGGGQLGRMLGLAGIPLGLSFRFLDVVSDAPAEAVGDLVVGESFQEAGALREFARGVDVVTYEFENVPAACVERLRTMGVGVEPNGEALATAQDRLLEKRLFERVGLRVPKYSAVDTQEELERAVEEIGLPCVLKTRRMGYDGKGQRVLRTGSDVGGAVAALTKGGHAKDGRAGQIVEQFVKFDREVSIIAVGGASGEGAMYPLAENRHENGILSTTRIPARSISAAARQDAEKSVWRIVKTLGYVGVLAVEFFVKDGVFYANEMAPRVHNSGHWTIEGAMTSQFENHLRAILGWPLGSTAARGACVMHNLVGVIPGMEEMLAVEGACVHLYGKSARPGRKVGHVTCIGGDDSAVEAASRRMERIIKRAT
ncbi:MAG: 5-(carboxyamino)imidazole ribonucleotide synthase [Phycisphaerales bacterium]